MTEPTHLLAVHTPDRLGIIAGVTGVLEASGAHLLELSQTVVRDYFTIILLVTLPEPNDSAALTGHLRAVLADGAAVIVQPYRKTGLPVPAGDRYVLTALGMDSPGIVHTISSLIAERGGNFSDLDCRVSGDRMRLVAELQLPRDIALDQLQIDLEHAGATAGLQVRLQHQRLFQATNEVAFRRLST